MIRKFKFTALDDFSMKLVIPGAAKRLSAFGFAPE
jgi:hypothetical protein